MPLFFLFTTNYVLPGVRLATNRATRFRKARIGNSATTCGTIAVGSQHSAD
ncbi:hypothetical protein [Photorhabdus aegyptia]|uniref:hypothetical protein n=1 Tax=Photorhabdus aegyptia TaxID=2805098 RepID=UPI001E37E458|nr:hypothetical protein [Photorhabdus aegyptia]